MIIEKKEVKTVCDCCLKELTDIDIWANNESFRELYLKRTQDNIDLCYTCAGKIFYREVQQKVPTEKMREWIKSLRKVEGSNLVESAGETGNRENDNCSKEILVKSSPNSSSNSLKSIDDPKSIKDL